MLCRPFKDLESTTRAKHELSIGDGKGAFVSSCIRRGSLPLADPAEPFTQPADKLIIDSVEKIAKKRGVSMAEVAFAWSCGSQWVTAPIVGIRSTERLDELIKGMDLELTKEERDEIDAHYQPIPIRGHE